MARSFLIPISSGPGRELGAAFADAKAHVRGASGGLVFVSGGTPAELRGVVDVVRTTWKGIPTAVIPAAGVLTERGEIEGESAASGILWGGGRTATLAVTEASALGEALGAAAGDRAATAVLFASPDGFDPAALDELAASAPRVCVLGAGTAGGAPRIVSAEGEVVESPVGGLVLGGLAAPVVEASPACRLLMPLQTIDEASGGMVLRVGGRAALDVLSSCASDVGGSGARPLVLAALADAPSDRAEGEAPDRFVIRPVRGVDPSRRAVLIGPEARPGARFAFAVRDAGAARSGLEETARRVAKMAMGAAPRFALYLSCAGRGRGLYGAPHVDIRILRQRFGDLPIAGMHSSFEISPAQPGGARMELYTGVLALFRSPS